MKDAKARKAIKILAQRINYLEHEIKVLKGEVKDDDEWARPGDPLLVQHMKGHGVDEELTEMITGKAPRRSTIE